MVAARLGGQEMGDTSGSIAAGAGLRSVGVAYAHEAISARRRRLDHDELIAADSGAAVGDGGGKGRGQAERARPFVEHDEVVPATMHFHEPGTHGSDISVS